MITARVPLFFVVFALSLANLSRGQDAPNAGSRPNILVIVADDLGYGELGYQGHNDIPTPHIDSIAKNGVRFTSGYVSLPGVQSDSGRVDDRPLSTAVWS